MGYENITFEENAVFLVTGGAGLLVQTYVRFY